MKTLFRILGTAAAVAVTGAAIVVLDKILNQKDPLHVEPPDHYDRLSSLLELSLSQSGWLMPLHSKS